MIFGGGRSRPSGTSWRCAWLGVLCVCLAACSASRVTMRGRYGQVTADSAKEATQIMELLDRYMPCVRAGRAGLNGAPYVAVIPAGGRLPSFYREIGALGYVDEAGVVSLSTIAEHQDRLAMTAVHELVHQQQHGSWSRMPAYFREGLADQVAVSCAPQQGRRLRAEHLAACLGLVAPRGLRLESSSPEGPGMAVTMTVVAREPEALAELAVFEIMDAEDTYRRGAKERDSRALAFLITGELLLRYGWSGLEAAHRAAEREGVEALDVRSLIWADGHFDAARLDALVRAEIQRDPEILIEVIDVLMGEMQFSLTLDASNHPPGTRWEVCVSGSPWKVPAERIEQITLEILEGTEDEAASVESASTH